MASERRPAGKARADDATIRTIIIDDQPVFRLGLRIYLGEAMPEVQIVGEADTSDYGIELADETAPALVLLDTSLRDRETTAVLAELRRRLPDCMLVLLANVADANDFALALTSSADGYLLKTISPAQLVAGLRAVLGGNVWVQPDLAQQMYQELLPSSRDSSGLPVSAQALTPRQFDVLRLITRGLRNTDIARSLHISEQTVKTHVAGLLRKLRVRNRLEAAHYAIRHKLVKI